MVVAVRGPEIGKGHLVLLDVTSGTLLRTVASGYFSGVSFSPDGTELAYSGAQSEDFPPPQRLHRHVAGGKPVETDQRWQLRLPSLGARTSRSSSSGSSAGSIASMGRKTSYSR